ncbi:MAG: alpha/beta fold hydrolase [Candidatus Nanopelagicales bacterium]
MVNSESRDHGGEPEERSSKFRVAALVSAFCVGLIGAVVLWTTSWNPVVNVPSASHELINAPEFASDKVAPANSFYTPPSPLPNVPPGTVLKSEPIQGAPAGMQATRIMYMSTKVNGEPVPVTAAFFVRTIPDAPPEGRPLIGFTHGTSGMGPKCGMSQAPFTPGTTGAQFFGPEMKPFIDAGYAVVATDYQNMGAPGTRSYLVKKAEAMAALDSMRASYNLAPNILDGSKAGVIGHSQGGQAALAAGSFATSYAPDVPILGVISQAPGMTVGMPLVMKQLVSGPNESAASRSEYLSYLAGSYAETYSDQMSLSDVLTPFGESMQPQAEELCGPPLKDKFQGRPLSDTVKAEFPTSFYRLANDNVPSDHIETPLLITQGDQDTAIVPEFTYATFRALCENGTKADMKVYPGDDHNSLLWTARTETISWMNDRMEGKPAPNGCVGRN